VSRAAILTAIIQKAMFLNIAMLVIRHVTTMIDVVRDLLSRDAVVRQELTTTETIVKRLMI
jgi:hypothetical protein